MSSINLHTREINIKVVYYGPGLGGKTTTLQHIHRTLQPELRGQLVSLATGIDRTLYFDFLPVKLPKVKGFTIRLSLYTVPGQVHYNATRKLVLQGCDGVVFVADSQPARREANQESLLNLDDNLRGHGMNPQAVPLVMQYNKRDLTNLMSVSEMDAELLKRQVPRFETCALSGVGVFEALRTVTKLVLADLKNKGIYEGSPEERPKDRDRAPVVSAWVEEGLVRTMESKPEPAARPQFIAQARVQVRGLTFSELWEPGPHREQILATEGDIERGNYRDAVRRAGGLLREYVGTQDGQASTPAEALLMLGVHGRHYARFRDSAEKSEPSKEDAIFCLFFLTDVELRMRATGVRVEE
jgi:signal recognition particle receptor subunit beta